MHITSELELNQLGSILLDEIAELYNVELDIDDALDLLEGSVEMEGGIKYPVPCSFWGVPEHISNMKGLLLLEHDIDADNVSDLVHRVFLSFHYKNNDKETANVDIDSLPIATNQFTPESALEFFRYAQTLSWLIDEPDVVGQALLARIYGFESVTNILNHLEKATEPGPYETDFWMPYKQDSENMLNFSLSIERTSMPRAIVLAYKGEEFAHSGYRYWNIDNIGLYHPPQSHSFLTDLVRGKIEVLEGVEKSSFCDVESYGFIEFEDEYRVASHFTFLGKAVFDALRTLLPDDKRLSSDDFDEAQDTVFDIIERHSDCPWARGVWVCWAAKKLGMTQWQDSEELLNCLVQDNTAEAIQEFVAGVELDAKELIEDAKVGIVLFKRLMRVSQEKNTAYYLPKQLCDERLWPEMLYHSGCVALNAGEFKEAKDWLSECYYHTDYSGLLPHYYLSTIAINENNAGAANFFRSDQCDVWAALVKMCCSMLRDDFEDAAGYFANAVCLNPFVLTMYGESPGDTVKYAKRHPHDTNETVLEFFYKTGSYWGKNKNHGDFVRLLSNDKGIRTAVIAYHEYMSGAKDKEFDVFTERHNELVDDINAQLVSTLKKFGNTSSPN